MYYYCAKMNAFKLPALTERIPAGGIIAASATTCGTLRRRSFMPHAHLKHRLLDPQLYLASLDPANAATTIFKLGTYEWFGMQVPDYSSAVHKTHAKYKDDFKDQILEEWTRSVPTEPKEIYDVVLCCLKFQLELGCDMLVGPAPLTNQALTLDLEIRYLDALCKAAKQLKTHLPVLATFAVSDSILQNIPPVDNIVIKTIADQISARPELAGIYLVPEQATETGYVPMSEDALHSILVLVDDLALGASKRVVVNYAGSFSPVLTAAGAEIWSTGYYRSQRRMRLADQMEIEGRAYPRFFSRALGGDIGVEEDMPALTGSKIFNRVFTKTKASRSFYKALVAGAVSPEWEYKIGNIWPAAAHYSDVMSRFSDFLDSMSSEERITAINDWLLLATDTAETLKKAGVDPKHTDIQHQKIWLAAFQKWKEYSQA